ncbi:MAG: ImmA/IrrE family metallo-endopeptidase [Chloroflexi bacterium]|nr:ImmA/IrrE family metallo-endopeptidase [Chloroflexota bacterium]
MDRAAINPAILQWARERAALSHGEIAKRVNVKEETLHLWETGAERPTFRQAQALARALHIPLGYLFLSEPPQTVTPITDFRTLPHAQRGQFSPELEATINDALRKRDWLREWRIQEGAEPLPFIGRFKPNQNPETIANNIREVLDIPLIPPKNIRTWEEQLRSLIGQAETAGILILQNSVTLSDNRRPLSVDEFRGFTLVDPYAPVIFINTQDTIAGRIFTLAHELAHLWTGMGGISNPDPYMPENESEIERFCNQVAAELLVPRDEFLREWQLLGGDDPLEKAQELAAAFRVSVFVVLIRAREQGLIAENAFRRAYGQAAWQVEALKEDSEGQPGFFNVWRVRNGRVLVNELLRAVRQGDVLYREASQLLNVSPKTLESAMGKFL